MAKKQFWKDNTTPPTNFIWCKLNDFGQIEGVYEHNGVRWVKIASGNSESGDGVPTTSKPNKIYATDLNGNQITIDYNIDIVPNTIAIRTDYGSLRGAYPKKEDDLVPSKMMMWNE